MIETLKKHLTQVVFWGAVVLSVASLILAAALESALIAVGIGAVVVSVLFNLWSVLQHERGGFVQAREYRRAHEPARRFNALQVFVIFGLVVLQCMAIALKLLTIPR